LQISLLLFVLMLRRYATDYVVSEPRPLPPINVTAQWQRSGVRISWMPSSPVLADVQSSSLLLPSDDDSFSTPLRYYIQYRTVGHWVPLVDVPANVTSYDWTTASRGATYHFRLMSGSADDMLSQPSAEVIIRTTGWMRSRDCNSPHLAFAT